MTSIDTAAILAAARAVVPGLVRAPGLPTRRSIKCALVPAIADGRRVIVKALHGRDVPWRWYLEREIALYDAFRRDPPPVSVPELVGADAARGLLVVTHVEGRPLATARHDPRARAHPSDERWRALLSARAAIASWDAGRSLARLSPNADVVRALRARVLEDPSATGWIADGARRCAELGVLRQEDAERIVAALAGAPVAFQHGDLLLRNVIARADALTFVDWECAGPHLACWDAALLWVWAPAWARTELARAFEAHADALTACVAFAFAREIALRMSLRRGEPEADPIGRRLRDALADVLRRLR